ncbi:hypothetical protein KW791_04000 [Candidatus Parcubacteria bacterium]|nr:hypothetical protein [Candidatus Parcubacteria bacterium]
MNLVQKWKNLKFWQKNTILVIILGLLLFYFPFYGLTFPPCNEREHEALPNDPQNKKFEFKSNPYVLAGNDHCSPTIKEAGGYITVTNNLHPADKTEYILIKTVYLRLYGLSGVFDENTGNGWVKYFIITDSNNNKYYVYCAALHLYSTLDQSILNCNSSP